MKHFELSERKIGVLLGIMRGDRDREIAVRLGISHSVVRSCGVALRRELGVRSRTEVAVRGVQLGYLDRLN